MILDILERLDRYVGLAAGLDKAVSFLSRPDLADLAEGKHEIEGDEVYAVVAREHGRAQADARLETHDRYIDIQLVLAGEDTMGWKARSHCDTPAGPYDKDRDLCFYTDEPDVLIPVKPGSFCLFFPEDAHMPLISDGMIHKVVVKIRV